MKLIIFLFFIATIEPSRLKSVLSRSGMCYFENCTSNDIVPTSAQNQGSTDRPEVGHFYLGFGLVWSQIPEQNENHIDCKHAESVIANELRIDGQQAARLQLNFWQLKMTKMFIRRQKDVNKLFF